MHSLPCLNTDKQLALCKGEVPYETLHAAAIIADGFCADSLRCLAQQYLQMSGACGSQPKDLTSHQPVYASQNASMPADATMRLQQICHHKCANDRCWQSGACRHMGDKTIKETVALLAADSPGVAGDLLLHQTSSLFLRAASSTLPAALCLTPCTISLPHHCHHARQSSHPPSPDEQIECSCTCLML